MNKYIILVIILLLPISFSLKAQLSINFNGGYGWYQMGDMKKIAEEVMGTMNTQMGGKLKMTDNFPAFITYSGEVTYQLKEHEFGISGGYMSTGAKYAYSDYSGKYTAKIVADAFKIGLIYKYHFFETKIATNPFSVFASVAPSAVLTDINIEDEMQLYEQGMDEKNKENLISSKFGFSIQPMMGCRLTLLNHLLIQMSAGYDFELGTKINPAYRVNWSGFRLNAGVGFMF